MHELFVNHPQHDWTGQVRPEAEAHRHSAPVEQKSTRQARCETPSLHHESLAISHQLGLDGEL